MDAPLVLVTGFGAFPGVERNPSREIAVALAAEPPDGVRVHVGELPVAFRDVSDAFDALLERAPAPPDVLLALGVHRGPGFRLERRARGLIECARPDATGHAPGTLALGRERASVLDLHALADVLRAAGADPVRVSHDAGQYVCERTYWHVLGRAAERSCRALFLHVPPIAELAVERQVPIVRVLVAWLAADAAGRYRAPS